MPAYADLVHETSVSTGTGNQTIAAVLGKRRFTNGFATGGTNIFDYFISSRAAAEWERGTGHLLDANTLVRDTVLASSNANALVNFAAGTKDITNDQPADKRIDNTAVSTEIAAKAVRYDVAQSLTSNQQAQARANVNVTKRNYIINGGMQISQENGGVAGTASAYHPVDMFQQASVVTLVTTTQQIAAVTPGGSPNRVRLSYTGSDAAPAAGHYWAIRTFVEGLQWADLRSGSAAAKTITIQFGVKAPAGTYHVSVENSPQNRSYPASYVISAGEANTDVIKSVTIPLDTTGTWAVDNTAGAYIWWTLVAGANLRGTVNAWQAGDKWAGPSQLNFIGTAGNVFELFDVSLTEGSIAPAFELPAYESELLKCQRYFEYVGSGATGICMGTYVTMGWQYKVTKRASPTVTLTASSLNILSQGGGYQSSGGSTAAPQAASDLDGSIYSTDGFSGTPAGQPCLSNSSNWMRVSARL